MEKRMDGRHDALGTEQGEEGIVIERKDHEDEDEMLDEPDVH